MVREAFALALLLSSVARGQEARLVAPGHVITEPSWVYSVEGKRRVDAWISDATKQSVDCRTQNEALRKSIVTVSAEPTITAKGVLIVGGAILVVGFTAGLVLGKRL